MNCLLVITEYVKVNFLGASFMKVTETWKSEVQVDKYSLTENQANDNGAATTHSVTPKSTNPIPTKTSAKPIERKAVRAKSMHSQDKPNQVRKTCSSGES